MRTILLLCVILAGSATGASGQARVRHLPTDYVGDTTNQWYKRDQARKQEVGLGAIEKSPDLFHFRFSVTRGEIVDIWRKDSLFQGCLTKWVRDNDKNLGVFERYYSQRYELGAAQAAAIGQLIKKSGLLQLPSDKAIKGWRWGADGEVLTVEYVQDGDYYLKSYWTPTAQNGVPEAVLIHQFDEKIFELVNIKTVRKAFEAGIPFSCYGDDGMVITCLYTTASRYWQQKRDVKRYVRQMQQAKKK